MRDAIIEKLDRIINIMQTKGVQPSDLASNIFEHGYKSIKTVRANGCILTDICFDEIVNNIKRNNVTLRYTHNFDSELLRVEEIFSDHVTLQWDRESIIRDTISDVVAMLRNAPNETRLNFIASLPPYLRDMIDSQVSVAA